MQISVYVYWISWDNLCVGGIKGVSDLFGEMGAGNRKFNFYWIF